VHSNALALARALFLDKKTISVAMATEAKNATPLGVSDAEKSPSLFFWNQAPTERAAASR